MKNISTKKIVTLALAALVFVSQILTMFSFNGEAYAEAVTELNSGDGLDLALDREVLIAKPDEAGIIEANKRKPILEAEERKAQERLNSIKNLTAFLKAKKSPVASEAYATQIIDLAAANNADYKIIVAIMGVESGFCRATFKIKGANSHNCFGYLNGVTYGNFTDALNSLVPKISRQYAVRYGWNFEALAKAYGQIGWEKTSRDMRIYANAL